MIDVPFVIFTALAAAFIAFERWTRPKPRDPNRPPDWHRRNPR